MLLMRIVRMMRSDAYAFNRDDIVTSLGRHC